MSTFRQEYLTRQSDLINADALNSRIVVIGAGAIGSFTVLALSKLGYCNIHVYDDDVVDDVNLNCQFFKISDIGKKKVDALAEQVKEFIGLDIHKHYDRIKEHNVDEINAHILITAVDNMECRRLCLEEGCYLFTIDPRMGAEYATMDVVHRSKGVEFASKLYGDKDAVQERCTAKSTMYTVLLISGQVCKAVKDLTNGIDPIKTFNWDIKNNKLLSIGQDGKIL